MKMDEPNVKEGYYCSRCCRRHVRGKVFEEHRFLEEKIAQVQKEIDAAAIHADLIQLPKLTEIRNGEVVNTPAYKDTTAEYEARTEFHKHSPYPDRIIDSMQQDEFGKIVHGQPVTPRKWWQFWRR